MQLQGSWAVQYQDGSWLSQYDEHGVERPYRAIDWKKAARLHLESQNFSQIYDVYPAPPGMQLSMRGRGYMDMMENHRLFVYLIVLSEAGVEVTEASTVSVLYWLPTGIEHHCWQLDCPEIRKYAQAFLRGETLPMMPAHGTPQVAANAVLVWED